MSRCYCYGEIRTNLYYYFFLLVIGQWTQIVIKHKSRLVQSGRSPDLGIN